MATPRKHWFNVADSILREDWDDATLASVVRLMAWLNQRWARDGIPSEEAGNAVIGALDAMSIMRTQRPHLALQRLAKLPSRAGLGGAEASLSGAQRPVSVTLRWPKYSEFQHVRSRGRGNLGATRGLHDAPSAAAAADLKNQSPRPYDDPTPYDDGPFTSTPWTPPVPAGAAAQGTSDPSPAPDPSPEPAPAHQVAPTPKRVTLPGFTRADLHDPARCDQLFELFATRGLVRAEQPLRIAFHTAAVHALRHGARPVQLFAANFADGRWRQHGDQGDEDTAHARVRAIDSAAAQKTADALAALGIPLEVRRIH